MSPDRRKLQDELTVAVALYQYQQDVPMLTVADYVNIQEKAIHYYYHDNLAYAKVSTIVASLMQLITPYLREE